MTPITIISEDVKILVFRSDIASSPNAALVRRKLLQSREIFEVNIDLEDSENVLRVECYAGCSPERIENQVARLGFSCSEFTDY